MSSLSKLVCVSWTSRPGWTGSYTDGRQKTSPVQVPFRPDSTNFTDRTSIGANGNGLRHSASMRMVEHFTRVSDEVILYDVTVDDQKTYERPFTIAIPLISPPGFQPLPYECHEGNGAVKYALSGARAYEAAVADAKAKGLPPPKPSSSVHEDVAR